MRTKKNYRMLLLGVVMVISIFFISGCEVENTNSIGKVLEYKATVLDNKYKGKNYDGGRCNISLMFENTHGRKGIDEYSSKNEDICKSAKIGVNAKVYVTNGKNIQLIKILGDEE